MVWDLGSLTLPLNFQVIVGGGSPLTLTSRAIERLTLMIMFCRLVRSILGFSKKKTTAGLVKMTYKTLIKRN